MQRQQRHRAELAQWQQRGSSSSEQREMGRVSAQLLLALLPTAYSDWQCSGERVSTQQQSSVASARATLLSTDRTFRLLRGSKVIPGFDRAS